MLTPIGFVYTQNGCMLTPAVCTPLVLDVNNIIGCYTCTLRVLTRNHTHTAPINLRVLHLTPLVLGVNDHYRVLCLHLKGVDKKSHPEVQQ